VKRSRAWPLQVVRTGLRHTLPRRLVDAYFEYQSGTPAREACWRYLHGFPEFSYLTRTRHGWLTYSNKDWALGRPLFLRGEIEWRLITRAMAELRARDLLRPGGLLVDVGANIGTVTIPLLRDGTFRRAVAIEPIPGNTRRLRRNLWLNRVRHRVRVVKGAAGPTAGIVAMALSPVNHGDHRIQPAQSLSPAQMGETAWPTVPVPCYRLDDVVPERPALLWMDVQGFELRVLAGAPRVLATGVPVVMEFGPYLIARSGITVEEYCEFISSRFATFVDLGIAGAQPVPTREIGTLFTRYRGLTYSDLLLVPA
jgi:FkbM family methyltransferase